MICAWTKPPAFLNSTGWHDMDGFRVDLLSALATKATGKPCTVRIERLDGAWGSAHFDGKSYIVTLHSMLFATRDARGVVKTFWHECAHVALGHCPRPTERTEATVQAAREWVTTPAGKSREAAADEWAAAAMWQVPAFEVWNLALA